MHLGLKFDRLKYWLTVGAKPTDKVAELLGHAGVLPQAPKPPIYNPPDPKNDTKWRAEVANK
ncbi:hypothetical protein GPECTOR_1g420 [Gonium pectorale]|uniref:Ribosomal protein S16 n=1 Tax=Gonium pectorale TaxID=33097 RepID=A0A150H4G7_GONPE|nr:hypothetical protein GPECTOR_1g420 [Gonium pectorale]|eukprot:KXZ56470.1 hypothetical protein GPECTOR_1g420 [Gonium pectorale]